MERKWPILCAAIPLLACGGRMMTVETDGGLGPPKDSPCTESDCSASVQIVATLDGYSIAGPPTLFVGGGFVYTEETVGGASGLGGALVRAPVAGGPFVSFVEHANAGVAAILADDNDVYWGTNCQGAVPLFDAPHAGGTPVPFGAGSLGPNPCPTPFFIDSTHVYWVPDTASVHTAPISGGSEQVIPFARSDPSAPMAMVDGLIVRDDCTGSNVPSEGVIPAGYGMVADKMHCYELHGDCGQAYACGDLVAIPMGGGAMTILAKASSPSSTEFDATRMMLDELGVYLLKYDDRPADVAPTVLIRVPKDGGSPTRLTSDKYVDAYAITSDRIYWLAGKEIKSMPKYKP